MIHHVVSRRVVFARLLGIAAVAPLVLTGCGREDPVALLQAMGRAYREAPTYVDDGRVQIAVTRGDSTTEQTLPFRVAFDRPDRLRIDAYDARIVADGARFRAAVGGVPGQVLVADVEQPLTLEQIFGDRELSATLAEGEAGCPTQLPLLLADDTIDLILAESAGPPRITGTESIDGHPCARVEVQKADGTLVLWIDRGTSILRRMKVPTDAYADLLSKQSGAVTGVSVVVDFAGASFTAPLPPEAFSFEVPEGAMEVSRLEPLRPPRPASPLLGKQAEEFALTPLQGEPVTRGSLAGSVAVLEFFFDGCDPCNRTMAEVAKGVADFRASRSLAAGEPVAVRHFAVSVDEADVSDTALVKKLAEYGGVGAILRDPRGEAATALGLEAFPALVILAADGTIADVQIGEHNRLARDVAATLAAVAAGTDTAPLVRARHESRLREYRADLERAAGKEAAAGAVRRLPEHVIAPRRQPVRFKVVRAWRAEGVTLPGNVVCLDAAHGGEPEARVVALDGWRTVVELDPAGREVARHELALPKDAAVGFLRTAVDATGKRWWLGAARGGQHVFVFDRDWKLHATYPEPGGAVHDGISSAQFADTDGDGTPEIIVGYLGTVGLQAATLDGKRLWRDRAAGTVLDVALDAPREGGRGVVCVTADGRIAAVSPAGQSAERKAVGDHRLRALASGPVAPHAAWAFLGWAGNEVGTNVAVGLTAAGEPLWELPLADGIHREGPIEPIAWADLLGSLRWQWLIAAPDGSVTVAWADGGVVDRYQHGAALVGIGGYRHAGEGYIVLATRTGLEAFRLDDIALD